MKTIAEQKKILAPLLEKRVPTEMYAIPDWHEFAQSYQEAVEHVFGALKASRSFFNYREGQLVETDRKTECLKKCKRDGKYILIEAQMGTKWKGVSVKDARTSFDSNEFGLGVYEVGCILLSHPELLQKNEDLWIDCAGDEFKPSGKSEFECAPHFKFHDDKLKFGAHWFDYAYGNYGSSSGFVPQ